MRTKILALFMATSAFCCAQTFKPTIYVQPTDQQGCRSLLAIFPFFKTCTPNIMFVVGPIPSGSAVRIEASYTEAETGTVRFIRQVVDSQTMNGQPYALYRADVGVDFAINVATATVLNAGEVVKL